MCLNKYQDAPVKVEKKILCPRNAIFAINGPEGEETGMCSFYVDNMEENRNSPLLKPSLQKAHRATD